MTILANATAVTFLLLAAITDVRWRTIPNRVVLLVALVGIVARSSDGSHVLFGSLLVAGFVFATMLLLFHFGIVGGGDVKLLAAASLLSVPADVPSQLVLIALAGGVMAMVFVFWRFCRGLYRKSSTPGAQNHQAAARVAHSLSANQQNELPGFHGDGLPYGVAICIGTIASMALS